MQSQITLRLCNTSFMCRLSEPQSRPQAATCSDIPNIRKLGHVPFMARSSRTQHYYTHHHPTSCVVENCCLVVVCSVLLLHGETHLLLHALAQQCCQREVLILFCIKQILDGKVFIIIKAPLLCRKLFWGCLQTILQAQPVPINICYVVGVQSG